MKKINSRKIIVVTGGCGFIGKNMCELLIAKGYYIINVDKISYPLNKIKITHPNKNYRFIKEDINNKKIFKIIFKKYTPIALINLAAETHVDRSIEKSFVFFKTNVMGTLNILESVKKYQLTNKKFKMIHVSTDEVYGDIKNKKPSKEIDGLDPTSPYASSKASADLTVMSYFKTFKTPVIITRCCNNYGPFQFPEKLIPKFILLSINEEKLPIYGNGKNYREWIYVKDHCEAIYQILKKGKIGHIYNIGSNENKSNNEITNKIIGYFKKKFGICIKKIYIQDRPGHDYRYQLNSTKIKKEINWKIKYTFDNSLSSTIKWYYDNYNKKKIKRNFLKKRIGLWE
jgi:dTDP-glucose 4,6-dehydratase